MAAHVISKHKGKIKSHQYSDERDDMEGLRAEARTIAELLKPLGCATPKFGQKHLGGFKRPVEVGESGC